jgi:uncharacterized protein YecE (DUF72 family)
MQSDVGSSGFSYKSWKGVFYPKGVKEADFLAYYAARLASVEVNNTFYRMPGVATIERWVSQVPGSFRFAVKAPQRLTHQLRLKEAAVACDEFVSAVSAFGTTLGPVLFQLPPNFRVDRERLGTFLAGWPARLPCAFEFRHESWLDESIFQVLRDHNVALCPADGESLSTPLMTTASHGYVRLRAPEYTPAALLEFSQRLRQQTWQSLFVYFKHEDTAPEYARELSQLLTS